METTLQTLISGLCTNTWNTVAPAKTGTPYAVWQFVGGRTLRYIEGAAADKRNSLIQVSVWASKSSEATALIRSIEDALCTSGAFSVDPQGEALSTYEEDTKLYGAIQRYSITAARS